MNSENFLLLLLLIRTERISPHEPEVRNIITAGLLIQIASTLHDEHSKAALQNVAGRLFEGYTKQ